VALRGHPSLSAGAGTKLRSTFFFLVLLVTSCEIGFAQQAQRIPDYKITALKAMLFYDNKGTFSPDVAQPESEPFLVPSILWNTPIEGASREGAASQVMITVEVDGEYAATVERKIELTARYKPVEGKREIVVRRFVPITIRENGKFVAGFWLDQAGCNPVRLSARIMGQRQPSTTKRIIKFGCGE
jgi:hypothetical protein